jgi:hypothetical protein
MNLQWDGCYDENVKTIMTKAIKWTYHSKSHKLNYKIMGFTNKW